MQKLPVWSWMVLNWGGGVGNRDFDRPHNSFNAHFEENLILHKWYFYVDFCFLESGAETPSNDL